jgi:hypothetical protein
LRSGFSPYSFRTGRPGKSNRARRAILAVDAVLAIAQRHNGAIDRRKPLRDRHAQFRDSRTAFRGQQLAVAPRLPLFLSEEFAERLTKSISQSVGLLLPQQIGCI